MVFPCDVDESVEIYNDCNFLKLVWVAGDDTGRIDYIPKNNVRIQKNNTNEFSLYYESYETNLQYSEISTTSPLGHTTIDQLLTILSKWICTEDAQTSASTRISTCINLFNAQFRYDDQPILFNKLTSSTDPNDGVGGTGSTPTVTHNVNPSAVFLNTFYPGTDPANDNFPYPSDQLAVYQTKPYMPYQSDSLLIVTISALIRTVKVVDHNVARIGYFDDANNKDVNADIGGSGVFFQLNADGVLNVGRRKYDTGAQVDELFAQSAWNLDKLDGSGTSGVVLDTTKILIFYFDMEMNGGRIRYGFNIGGSIIYCHEILIANTEVTPTLFNYSLPIRAELQNSSPGGDGVIQGDAQMNIYSTSVDLCGNSNSITPSNPFNYTMHSIAKCARILAKVGDHRPLLSIRLDPTKSRATIWPKRIDIDCKTGTIVLWRLILNPTGLTPTWQSVSNKSFAQYSTNDNSVSIGADSVVITSGYTSSLFSSDVQDLFNTYGLYSNIDGTEPDVLSLTVEYVQGNSKARGTISWQETK